MGNSNAVMLDDVYGTTTTTTTTTIRSNASRHCNSSYQLGEKVFALSAKQYWEAQVIKVRSGSEIRQYLVHYPGWSEEWDEWLGVEYLKKHNDNDKHLICEDLNLNKDSEALNLNKDSEATLGALEIKQKKICRMLKQQLRREKKRTKKLRKMVRTVVTLLHKSTAALDLSGEAAQPLLQADITEEIIETTSVADLSAVNKLVVHWISLFGANVELSLPTVRGDLLKVMGHPKGMAQEDPQTREEVLISSLNVANSIIDELCTMSDNLCKEKEELEKNLEEKSSVVDKLSGHFTRRFRKLLSERREVEDTLEMKEKEWKARQADLKKQLDEAKAEVAFLQDELDKAKDEEAFLLDALDEMNDLIFSPQFSMK